MFTAKEPFPLLPEERAHLQQLLRATRVSAGLARRARALLLLADGRSVRHIQSQTGLSPRRTLHWKQRWRENGLDGLLDAPRARRPRKITAAKEVAIVSRNAPLQEHSVPLSVPLKLSIPVG